MEISLLIKYKGGENNTMTPLKLEQLKDSIVNPKRKGGKKVDFAPIVQQIIQSGQYYSVREVHVRKDMVNQQVSRFRTMKLLQRYVLARKLQCFDLKGTYYYGAIPKTQ